MRFNFRQRRHRRRITTFTGLRRTLLPPHPSQQTSMVRNFSPNLARLRFSIRIRIQHVSTSRHIQFFNSRINSRFLTPHRRLTRSTRRFRRTRSQRPFRQRMQNRTFNLRRQTASTGRLRHQILYLRDARRANTRGIAKDLAHCRHGARVDRSWQIVPQIRS